MAIFVLYGAHETNKELLPLNILEARAILMAKGWERFGSGKASADEHETETEFWRNDGNILMFQIFDNDPSVGGASKSWHLFRIKFTSLGHSDSPFKSDSIRMLEEAMR